MGKFLGLALALSFTCAAAACGGNDDTGAVQGSGYMTMDINPSVELILEDGYVTEIKAANDDGEILIAGEQIEGLSVEEASKKLVALAEELGYLTDANKDVKITVLSDSESLATALEALAKEGAEKGSLKALINHDPRSKDEREGARKGLEAKKLRLIEAIMEYDETMTYEIGEQMTVGELINRLDEVLDDHAEVIGVEMKEAFKQKLEDKKAAVEGAIAAFLGDEYLAAWTTYMKLEGAYKLIEKAAEFRSVSTEDVSALLETLGLTEEQLNLIAGEDGAVTPDEIDDFFDKHFDDMDKKPHHGDFWKEQVPNFEVPDKHKLDQIEDAIDDLLDGYDEDAYVLSQAEYDALALAWGESEPALPAYEEFNTLEKVEEFVEAREEELEEMKEELIAQLDAVQLFALNAIKDGFKDCHEEAKNELHAQMEQAKQSFLDKKAERRAQRND